jgi:hypothetical protein
MDFHNSYNSHQFLTGVGQTDQLTGYVHFVVRSIHGLKFAADWKEKGTTTEGHEWKKDYLDRLFIFQEQDAIKDAERYAGQMGKKKLHSAQRKFKARHEKVVAARNHILWLYDVVSIIYILMSTMIIFHSLVQPYYWILSGLLIPKSKQRAAQEHLERCSHISSTTSRKTLRKSSTIVKKNRICKAAWSKHYCD